MGMFVGLIIVDHCHHFGYRKSKTKLEQLNCTLLPFSSFLFKQRKVAMERKRP